MYSLSPWSCLIFFWHVSFGCFVYSSLFCHVKFMGMSNLSVTYKDKYKENKLGNLIISVQFSHSVMSDSLWPHELQHAKPPCPSPTPRVHPNPGPLRQWRHPTSSVAPSPPALNLSQHQGLFQRISSSHQVAKLLECQLQHHSFQWTPRTGLL